MGGVFFFFLFVSTLSLEFHFMKYLDTAATANRYIHGFVDQHFDEPPTESELVEFAARCINYGIRIAPRAVHNTVRERALKRAVQDLPVEINLEDRTSESGRPFKELVTRRLMRAADHIQGRRLPAPRHCADESAGR
jgi:hypothetical protein